MFNTNWLGLGLIVYDQSQVWLHAHSTTEDLLKTKIIMSSVNKTRIESRISILREDFKNTKKFRTFIALLIGGNNNKKLSTEHDGEFWSHGH